MWAAGSDLWFWPGSAAFYPSGQICGDIGGGGAEAPEMWMCLIWLSLAPLLLSGKTICVQLVLGTAPCETTTNRPKTTLYCTLLRLIPPSEGSNTQRPAIESPSVWPRLVHQAPDSPSTNKERLHFPGAPPFSARLSRQAGGRAGARPGARHIQRESTDTEGAAESHWYTKQPS